MKILLDRFLKNSEHNIKYDFYWNEGEYITLKDIDNALKNGVKETSEPYSYPSEPQKYKDKQYHISRIIYFINHPEEIKDIEIGYYSHGMRGIYRNSRLVDGLHRLAAATYLQFKEIDVVFTGRQDVLDYLTGKRQRQPYGTSWNWAE